MVFNRSYVIVVTTPWNRNKSICSS